MGFFRPFLLTIPTGLRKCRTADFANKIRIGDSVQTESNLAMAV